MSCLSCWAGSRKLPPHSSGLSPSVVSVSWREFSVVVVFSRNTKVKHKREKFSTDGLTRTECASEENDKPNTFGKSWKVTGFQIPRYF